MMAMSRKLNHTLFQKEREKNLISSEIEKSTKQEKYLPKLSQPKSAEITALERRQKKVTLVCSKRVSMFSAFRVCKLESQLKAATHVLQRRVGPHPRRGDLLQTSIGSP